jgi:WD40 repeat protein
MPVTPSATSPFEALVRAVRAERIALGAHPHDFASIVGNRMASEHVSWQVIEGVFRVEDRARPLLRWRQAIAQFDAVATVVEGSDLTACATTSFSVVGGSADGWLFLWNERLEGGAELMVDGARPHDARITLLEFMNGGELLLSADAAGQCRLWIGEDVRHLQQFSGHTTAITGSAFHGGRQVLAAGAADGSVRVWERQEETSFAVLAGHAGAVTALSFCPDAQHLASASSDGTVRVWETFSGRCLGTLRGHGAEVIHCEFLPAGSTSGGDPQILTASRDGLVKLWTRDGSSVTTLGGHDGPINDLRLTPSLYTSPTLAVTGGDDGSVRIWDIGRAREVRVLRGHQGPVLQVGACGDQFGKILSLDASGACRLWDHETGRLLRELGVDGGRRAQLSVSPQGDAAACVTEGGTLTRFDLTISTALPADTIVAVDPEGGRLLLAAGRHLRLVEWVEASLLAQPSVSENREVVQALWAGVYYLTLHADGSLASWTGDGTNGPTLALPPQTTAVTLNDEGSVLIAGRADGSAVAFRPDLRLSEAISEPLATLDGGRSRVGACACATDGLTLLGADDGTLRLWNPLAGELLLDLVAHPFPILDCDISSDGSLLVSASSDGALRVWEAQGRMRQHISAHGAEVTGCRIGSAPNRALTCSRDQTVKLWDLESGRCLETFYGDAPFVSLAVAQERPLAVVADARGRVTVLEILDGFDQARPEAAP